MQEQLLTTIVCRLHTNREALDYIKEYMTDFGIENIHEELEAPLERYQVHFYDEYGRRPENEETKLHSHVVLFGRLDMKFNYNATFTVSSEYNFPGMKLMQCECGCESYNIIVNCDVAIRDPKTKDWVKLERVHHPKAIQAVLGKVVGIGYLDDELVGFSLF